MPKSLLIRGILAGAALLACVHLGHAQTGGGGVTGGGGATGGGGLTGGSGSTGGGIGMGTTSGQAGGIQSLGTAITGKSSSSSNTIPAASDPFASTYANPYAQGLSGVSTSFTTTSSGGVTQIASQTGFGQPVYAKTTTTQSITSSIGANTESYNSLNMPKTPPYKTVLGKSIPLVAHVPGKLQDELVSSLQRAPFLVGNPAIQLAVDGSTVILKGRVTDADQRRVVEGFVRMTPGVRNVVNELIAPAPQ